MSEQRPYRGKRKDKPDEYVYGWYYHWNSEGKDFIMQQHINSVDITHIEVIPETVGQSTGKKDKNGVDLDWWEGDLLREDGGKIMEVVYKDGCFWGAWIKHREQLTPLYVLITWADAIKKVGTNQFRVRVRPC